MTETKKPNDDYNINFERISELVTKYEQIKKSGEIKRYNEESTKKDFILPLFEALGWNTSNRAKRNDSISAEETISKKRVDYGFRINGIPKFYLEAKSLKEEDIQSNAKYVTQAIDYAWMKSCSWAILSNFETIAVYNADWKSGYFGGNLFFVLHPNDFLTDDRFRKLSKESFERNELDGLASKYGKKQVKNPINKQLLLDMISFRESLSKGIVKNNQDKHLSQDDIDESVQRILDRLIFIRNAEDRGLEENRLLSDVRQWSSKGKGELVKEISKVYSYFDNQYNSKLFAKHLCDDLYIDNSELQEVIEGLNHSKDGSYRYDFSIIESDVLGNIYEQYLGNILKSTPKRAKLESSKVHRKEQGIYYTPSYIVDYIVKNTVGEYIKTHSPEEIKNMRILDPACGSGSFLIRAYKELENYWKANSDFSQLTLDSEEFYSKKVEILKSNIFGVDLDPKAVEIAQLNLLLQISERKQRLPILQNNIKVGNSLIDDLTVSDRAFKWEEEFPEIMKNGGFDIVIGNPPYIKSRDAKDVEARKFIENIGKYETPYKMWDMFVPFVEKGIKLLRKHGKFSMIIPDTIGITDYTQKLGKMIIDKYSLYQTDFFPDIEVFTKVGVRSKIIFVQNDKTITKCKRVIHEKEITNERVLDYATNDDYSIFRINAPNIKLSLEDTTPLGKICYVSYGARFNSDKNDPMKFKKSDLLSATKDSVHTREYTEGKYIYKFRIFKKLYVEWGTNRSPSRLVRPTFRELYEPEKLLMARQKRVVAYSKNGEICDNTIVVGVPYTSLRDIDNSHISKYFTNTGMDRKEVEEISQKFSMKYLLAVLNSSLIQYLLRTNNRSKIDTYPDDWKNISIKFIDTKVQAKISLVSEKLLELNNRLNEIQDLKTDDAVKTTETVRKLESEINQMVYDVYKVDARSREIIDDYLR